MRVPENKTRSSRVPSTQVHSRTRVSWLLLAGRLRDHLSLGSERWRRCGPPLHPRTLMTSVTEPQGWDGARCPAARAQCMGRERVPHRRARARGRLLPGPAGLGSSHKALLPAKVEEVAGEAGGGPRLLFSAGLAGRRGGARAPEAIARARLQHPSREAPRRGPGSPKNPAHPEPRSSLDVELRRDGRDTRPAVPRGASGPPGLRR